MTTTSNPSPISSTVAASIASGLLQMQADRHAFADHLRKWVESLREEARDLPKPYPWIVEVRQAFVYGFGSVKWAGKIKAPAADARASTRNV